MGGGVSYRDSLVAPPFRVLPAGWLPVLRGGHFFHLIKGSESMKNSSITAQQEQMSPDAQDSLYPRDAHGGSCSLTHTMYTFMNMRRGRLPQLM